MYDILIVDDNANNRLVLRLILEEYAESNHECELNVEEAQDGEIAVEMAKSNTYHLIFMDIMMPKMDGIEATRTIRANDSSALIVAVSAIDDVNKQKEILQAGAEDYLAKPIDTDILNSRIENYLKLSTSRKDKASPFNDNVINLYTPKVYNRQLKFFIRSDDNLAELWEYYLLSESQDKSDLLADIVRVITAIGEKIIKFSEQFCVYHEENELMHFFTLDNADVLGEKIISLIMLKNSAIKSYKFKNNLISFALEKETIVKHEVLPKEVIPDKVEEEIAEVVVAETIFSSSQELNVYDFFDEEDLFEMKDSIQKLSALFNMTANIQLEEDEVEDITHLLEQIGKMQRQYNQSYSLGDAVSHLASSFNNNKEKFIMMSKDISPICSSFGNDLNTWVEMTFETGAPSIDFMDDSIKSNVEMIISFIDPPEVDENEEDDIFDF